MKNKFLLYFIGLLLILFSLNSCGVYRPVSVEETPIDPKERIKKNMEEGKGFRILDRTKSSGKFDFANYSGGIIITDWYSDDASGKESVKITIRFLTNEIRSDALDVKIFKKDCGSVQNCAMYEERGDLIIEIKKSILKKAALYKKNKLKSKGKDLGNTGFSKN